MNSKKLNIIAILAALSALAGCSTTHIAGYSHDKPIMSAADARSMISVEVRKLEPLPVEPALSEEELVAAAD